MGKILYSEHNLPLAIGKITSTAADEPGYAFGMRKEVVLAQLRGMVDAIERDELAVQQYVVQDVAKIDDFQETTVTLKFAAKRKVV